MTAAVGLKRVGLALGIVVACAIVGVAAISILIPADSVRSAIRKEIAAVTGLEPTIRGDTSVSVFPWGTVRFGDVTLRDARGGERALFARTVTARLRLVPLLFGRIEAADVALLQPQILVSLTSDGGSNWSSLAGSLARTFKPGEPDQPMTFSEIRIADGKVLIRDDARGIDETLTHVDMSLAWPAISKSFVATGRFAWHEQPVDASLSINDLTAAVAGDRTGLKLRLTSDPLHLAFEGHLAARPTPKVEGTLAVDTSSLRDTLAWAGFKPLPGGGFGRFALKAHTDAVGGTIALSGVNLELDGNSAEGVLAFTAEGRPAIQGTLAADDIDLTPYVSTVHLLRASERDWSRVPIMLDGLTDFDVDLRLSAAKIDMSSAKLGRTAVAANLRDGHLTITIGESQAFGGVLKGSLGIARSPAGASIRSELQFADVDLDGCLGDLFGIRRLEGKGTFSLAMEGSGDSVLAMTETLGGSATLHATQGALAGFNVEQLLRRLERRPLSGGGEFRRGRTPFDKLTVAVKLAAGTASIDEVGLESPAVRLALAGTASIPARDLSLKGTASLVSADPSSPAGEFALPFVVEGPWDDPIVLPDAESLIQHSGAAAPLLDAVRDRKTREEVRSAIERLTNGSVPSLLLPPAVAKPAAGPPPATR